MAGVTVAGGKHDRHPVDSEINMLPMIDLLLVAIFFLLNTAVVTEFSRVNANAAVPGNPATPCEGANGCPPEKRLRVDMRDKDKFVLSWTTTGVAPTDGDVRDVPRVEDVTLFGDVRVVRYPLLAASIEEEWRRAGIHRDMLDASFDQAILQTDDATPFGSIIGALDALHAVTRPLSVDHHPSAMVSAFNVTFATH